MIMIKQDMQQADLLVMNEPLRDTKGHLGSKKIDNSDGSYLVVNDQELLPTQTAQFPLKLHEMLAWSEQEGYESIVSWLPGKNPGAFKVHKKEAFVDKVMPKFFKQTQYKSFIRQLNLWDFERIIESSPNKGGYTHELFVKGNPSICKEMRRTKIKGKNSKLLSNAATRKNSRDDTRVEANRPMPAFPGMMEPYPSNQQQQQQNPQSSQVGDSIGIFPFMVKFGQPDRIEPQEMKYVQIGMKLGRLVSKGEWPEPA